jgi:quercetin dioxygenase-like cupin family protein
VSAGTETLQPFVRAADEGDALWILGGLYTWKAKGAETDNAYSLCEVRGPEGFAIPRHLHEREHEGFLVLEGTVTLLVNGEERRLGPGAFGFAPAGAEHCFRLDSADARLLLLITPGAAGHEAMFGAMGEPATSRSIPDAPTDVDPDALAKLAAQHGTIIVGPRLG